MVAIRGGAHILSRSPQEKMRAQDSYKQAVLLSGNNKYDVSYELAVLAEQQLTTVYGRGTNTPPPPQNPRSRCVCPLLVVQKKNGS